LELEGSCWRGVEEMLGYVLIDDGEEEVEDI
jgi:hypothetical protein